MQTVQLIECPNKKSVNYQGLNTRSKENSRWENIVNIDLNEGDQIAVESTVLNLRGISQDSTISLLGDDNENGLSDSKLMFRFSGYVNDNGLNTVHMPFVGSNREIIFKLAYEGIDTDAFRFPEFDDLFTLKKYGMETDPDNYTPFDYVCAGTYPNTDDETAPVNAGEINPENKFFFSYNNPTNNSTDQMVTPFNHNVKTIWSDKPGNGSWTSITGKKYTLVEEGYKGCYRRDDQGNWWWGETVEPQYFDAKVDVNAPLFESPSTIANSINEQLNASDVYGENNPTVMDDHYQTQKLPALTGQLQKVRQVNGENGRESDPSGRTSMYGNLAFLHFKHWQGVHRLMRADLAFDNRISLNEKIVSRKLYQPVFLMPNGHYDSDNQLDKGIYYPNASLNFTFSYEGLKDHIKNEHPVTKHCYFSTLPKYFLMCTNMKYTEANIQRIQTFMRNTEVYDGYYTDKEETDVENWRSHWNIGISHQSQYKDGNRYLYYCSQGNFNVLETVNDDEDSTDYGYACPYHPFADELPYMATSRSDIPDVGYTMMYSTEQADVQPHGADYYVIKEIQENYNIHRFKNNKRKDGSMALFSKYMSNWRDLVRTDGYDMTDVSYGDDSLSQQYDVMVVPVNMKGSPLPAYVVDLVNTYWIGGCQDIYPPLKSAFPVPDQGFMFKIDEGADDDHIQYGGLSLFQWMPYTGEWQAVDECYIYSFFNSTVKDGRDPVNGATYDGGDVVDLTSQNLVFVVDCGNTRRWVIRFLDGDDLSHANVYTFAGPGAIQWFDLPVSIFEAQYLVTLVITTQVIE